MRKFCAVFFVITSTGSGLSAQVTGEVAPLRNWPAPLYWQPSEAEQRASVERNSGRVVSCRTHP